MCGHTYTAPPDTLNSTYLTILLIVLVLCLDKVLVFLDTATERSVWVEREGDGRDR